MNATNLFEEMVSNGKSTLNTTVHLKPHCSKTASLLCKDPFTRSISVKADMTLAILFSLKATKSFENG